MKHFAYPNVRHGEFCGCGRYLSATAEQAPPAGYTPAQPHIGNLAELRTATLLLAPEWRTRGAAARIYESRDMSEVYQGDSLALAYLLASIGCVRSLVRATLALPGDIWCTGAVRLIDRQPFLEEVDLAGFDIKLEAFVTQSQDRVFLVPAVNLSPEQHARCHRHQVRVLTLREFRQRWHATPSETAWSDKLIVTLDGAELPLVVDLLFRAPPLPLWRRRLARRTAGALLALVLLVGLWWFVVESPGANARAVLRDEIERVLEALAGQVQWTEANHPQAPLIPPRPGEIQATVEDRARAEFAHWIVEVRNGYQRFPLPDAVYAAQRTNLAWLRESDRAAINRAYAAVAEARDRLALYYEALERLLKDRPDASTVRQQYATLRTEETANALRSWWFEILGNWLLLQPDQASLRAIQEVWLPQLVLMQEPGEALPAGAPGWQYTRRQRARLAQEKGDILARQEALRVAEAAPKEQESCGATPVEAVVAVQQAGWAYMKKEPQEALCFLEQALQTATLNSGQHQYVETSLAYLRNPEQFDGVLGVYLIDIDVSGAAARADLRQGDVILRYNQQPVKEPNDLSSLIAASHGTPTVAVELLRAGQRLTAHLPGGTSLSVLGTTLVVLWGHAL